MLKKIWGDPVWSKVIATVICATPPAIYYHLNPTLLQVAINILLIPSIPNLFVLLFTLCVIGVILYYKNSLSPAPTSESIGSDRWFYEIASRLSDCGYARLYLRRFDHPDNFRSEHRDALMKIMAAIKEKLESEADIKIISFNPTSEKSGVDWLRSELKGEEWRSAITICKKQPVANTSSVYLFDDKYLVFNKKTNEKVTYHAENLSSSIVHEMLRLGYDDMQGKIQ